MNPSEEKAQFEKIKNNDEKAFETLFHSYYGQLCLFASRILQDDDSAEEIVQDFFVKLWDKRHDFSIETSVKSYLFRSVKNLCLNLIEHNAMKLRYAHSVLANKKYDPTLHDGFNEPDLAQKIENCIESLPEKRRVIFKMSREEGLKYREIADKLNISVKTVETHMGLAIKSLRICLKDFRTGLILFLYFSGKKF
jgi:RNA polymerase sigma-70 factor (ECF subfamily)